MDQNSLKVVGPWEDPTGGRSPTGTFVGPFTAWTFPAHEGREDDCTCTEQDASIVSVLRDGMSSSLTSIPS